MPIRPAASTIRRDASSRGRDGIEHASGSGSMSTGSSVFAVRESEPLDRWPVTEALVLAVVVVLSDPPVERGTARRRSTRTPCRRGTRASASCGTAPPCRSSSGCAARSADAGCRSPCRSGRTAPRRCPGPKRPVNTLPLSERIASGTPWRAHRLRAARRTPASRSRAHDHRGHAEPRVVVDAGHDRGLGAVVKMHTEGDVHLPQLHRPGPLPPLVVRAAPTPALGIDELMTDQRAVDRRPGGQRLIPSRASRLTIVRGPQPGCCPTQLHDAGLDLRRHLVRTTSPAASCRPPARQARPPRTCAATYAPPGAPPHSGAPHRSRSRRR